MKEKIIVVMPAYNAEKTLKKTLTDMSPNIADEIILVDDGSHDKTVILAKKLGLKTFVHSQNRGYGGNQKTCYSLALNAGADIIVMIHPDYQYDSSLLGEIIRPIEQKRFDIVLGSRIRSRTKALEGGMPVYKYYSNRFLTILENIILDQNLSEYHTGFRAFTKNVIEQLPLLTNSDDYIFDNEMLTQCIAFGFRIGEISCPTKYFSEASSINFFRSIKYGFGVINTSIKFRLWKYGLIKCRLFENSETLKLDDNYYHLD